MRRLLLATMILGLAWPTSTVTAHVLSLKTAAAKARSEAYIIAGLLDERPAISVRSCSRVSRHVVTCRVRFRFRDEARTCRIQRIRVRFVSNTSRRLAVSFPPPPLRC